MTYQNNDGLNDLIRQAGMKTGINPNSIKQNIDSGKLDELVAKMNPNDAARFRQIMNNPALAQQMLNTPQAQMLIKRFMK